MVRRVYPPMPDEPAEELYFPSDEIPIHVGRRLPGIEQGFQRSRKIHRHPLVRIDVIHPFVGNREVVLRPVPLQRIIPEGMGHHIAGVSGYDFQRSVGAAGIHDKHLSGPIHERAKTGIDIGLLVVRQDDEGNRDFS